MWYWLGAAGVVIGGAVMFDVLDFFIWGFVAIGLVAASMKMMPQK